MLLKCLHACYVSPGCAYGRLTGNTPPLSAHHCLVFQGRPTLGTFIHFPMRLNSSECNFEGQQGLGVYVTGFNLRIAPLGRAYESVTSEFPRPH